MDVLARMHGSFGFSLWQVSNHWQKQMADALRPIGLTYVQCLLLTGVVQLSQRGDTVTQNCLAQFFATDVMMTSKVCRTLEKKGLLLRANNRLDARAKTLVVTKAGRALLVEALDKVLEVDQAFVKQLPDGEAWLQGLSLLQSGQDD